MYAIVEIAGKQFKVSKNQYIYAPKMEGDAGTAVSFDKVLLTDADGSVQVGSPTVSGVKVSGKILEHVKGDKVIVFKKKRRKGYAKRNGHRQQYTKVQIESIGWLTNLIIWRFENYFGLRFNKLVIKLALFSN